MLLSLLTGVVWLVAMTNIHVHCGWSYSLCLLVEGICLVNVTLQAYFQVIIRRNTGEEAALKLLAHRREQVCMGDAIDGFTFSPSSST
jgi:hypothetical protein